jgi:hypothetical protein
MRKPLTAENKETRANAIKAPAALAAKLANEYRRLGTHCPNEAAIGVSASFGIKLRAHGWG